MNDPDPAMNDSDYRKCDHHIVVEFQKYGIQIDFCPTCGELFYPDNLPELPTKQPGFLVKLLHRIRSFL